MTESDGPDRVRERVLLWIAVVPAAAPRVRVLRVATGAEAHTVGLEAVPDVISALMAPGAERAALPDAVRRPAHPGVTTLSDADARVEVRLDRPVIRQGDPFTIEIALTVDAESIARPTARCAVWVVARSTDRQPRARNAGVMSLAQMESALVAGGYLVETVVQLTELRAGQVCLLAAGFVESHLVVSPGPRTTVASEAP